jgi:hypothetical protein
VNKLTVIFNFKNESTIKKFPVYGWIGIGLILIFWFLNWNLDGLRTYILFFPLWLGYALTVDALVFYRKGSSLYKRSRKKYFSLFLISAPAWWLFELFNLRTQNWFYDGKQYFTELEYALYATISFSTVIPSVFGTAELASSFKMIRNLNKGIKFLPSRQNLIILFSLGWTMLLLLLIWPKYFFVLVWLSVYFIIEPINVWLKNRSLFEFISSGDWRPVFSLWIGCLICGFFWEMWNYFSYPKWIYDIHFANVLHLFEMPLPGYLGYIPFSMEINALYHFVVGFTKLKKDNFVQFG